MTVGLDGFTLLAILFVLAGNIMNTGESPGAQ